MILELKENECRNFYLYSFITQKKIINVDIGCILVTFIQGLSLLCKFYLCTIRLIKKSEKILSLHNLNSFMTGIFVFKTTEVVLKIIVLTVLAFEMCSYRYRR